jgi:hypothetical protein
MTEKISKNISRQVTKEPQIPYTDMKRCPDSRIEISHHGEK